MRCYCFFETVPNLLLCQWYVLYSRINDSALLFRYIITIATFATNNQNSFIAIFGSEVLHRRMRQNNLLGINLFVSLLIYKSNQSDYFFMCLPWYQLIHWFVSLFLLRLLHHRLLVKQKGYFYTEIEINLLVPVTTFF